MVRQQTWQEIIKSSDAVSQTQAAASSGARYASPVASTAQAILANLLANAYYLRVEAFR